MVLRFVNLAQVSLVWKTRAIEKQNVRFADARNIPETILASRRDILHFQSSGFQSGVENIGTDRIRLQAKQQLTFHRQACALIGKLIGTGIALAQNMRQRDAAWEQTGKRLRLQQ